MIVYRSVQRFHCKIAESPAGQHAGKQIRWVSDLMEDRKPDFVR